jgi:hypothetical protein
MKTILAAVVAAVLALALSSCGGGTSSNDEQASKALSASIMKSQKAAGGSAAKLLALKQKDADCISKGLVDKVGTDKLQKYGMLTKDLKANNGLSNVKMSAADAKAATDVVFGCTDVQGMMKKAMKSSGQVPAAMQACVDKGLTDTALRSMFAHVFSGDQNAAQQDLIKPMMKCAAPSGG